MIAPDDDYWTAFYRMTADRRISEANCSIQSPHLEAAMRVRDVIFAGQRLPQRKLGGLDLKLKSHLAAHEAHLAAHSAEKERRRIVIPENFFCQNRSAESATALEVRINTDAQSLVFVRPSVRMYPNWEAIAWAGTADFYLTRVWLVPCDRLDIDPFEPTEPIGRIVCPRSIGANKESASPLTMHTPANFAAEEMKARAPHALYWTKFITERAAEEVARAAAADKERRKLDTAAAERAERDARELAAFRKAKPKTFFQRIFGG